MQSAGKRTKRQHQIWKKLYAKTAIRHNGRGPYHSRKERKEYVDEKEFEAEVKDDISTKT